MTTDAHAEIAKLLPWYVNGTLGVAERDRVLEHLQSCDDCREEVSLCMEMQASAQQAGPTPILPATTSAQILDGANIRDAGKESWTWPQRWGVAAAVALVAILGVVTLGPNQTVLNQAAPNQTAPNQPALNQEFDAATSPAAMQTVDYVLELQFADGVSVDERAHVIAELGGNNSVMPAGQTRVQTIVRMAPKSLQELEQYAAEIESRREVLSAEIVALQLPLR